ncbi:acyl-CoA dehydrogenase family protein [Bradyrhizobium sp. 41S5]|uniref:acyl-CoA dehydrogenase family protein n=1 Tax=Bradyrhizobium sp. 41S5 TaxID=1404443 RepID=UPI0015955D8C|nr:acyl-CoA dehydrogenase family protein [Bradyrhizobium sp. 41S5]UFX43935.1 acyl-CoA dehydrogenase family protein [Bradyrhizobium sp. 41S5]
MNFRFSDKSLALQEGLDQFFRAEILPRNRDWHAHVSVHGTAPPFLEVLKVEARRRGLWNLGLPDLKDDQPGTRLTNLEFAPLAAIMGRLPWASIVFNCNAPNVPNMEILEKFGSADQKRQWLAPLLEGKVWTAFGMTEPDVASSDARNIRTSIRKEGGDYVIDGRKWYISGASHPDCKMLLVVGVTDPEGGSGARHSIVIVPIGTPGLEIVRPVPAFGRDREFAAELVLRNVRVPRSNLLGEEGAGFAIGQARLGVARVHHCMRSLGSCDVLIQLMRGRAANRRAFGRPIGEFANIQDMIAVSRIELEQAKLLVYKTAWLLDEGDAGAARREISMIKVAVARTYSAIADRAVQVFGAMGASDDTPISAAYTAARVMRIYDGPDEVHLRTLYRLEPNEVVGDSSHYLLGERGL